LVRDRQIAKLAKAAKYRIMVNTKNLGASGELRQTTKLENGRF